MTPGKYPKEHIQYSKHGESLKSTTYFSFAVIDFSRLLMISQKKKDHWTFFRTQQEFSVVINQVSSFSQSSAITTMMLL
jgi:hypothetical protein